MTIGENIKKYRKEKNLTQKQLGEKCGIDEANIRKYELGRQNPKLETLQNNLFTRAAGGRALTRSEHPDGGGDYYEYI